ncbi:MAG: hypothetical protein IKN06_03385 [Bacteroidales bacterium]|nr:hypothetical protein [Bacteroidales bacterium]
MRSRSFLLLLTLALAVACQGKEQPADNSTPETQKTPASITSLIPSSLSFSEEGGTQAVSFTSALSWTVSSDADWVTVSPASGAAGKVEIQVSAAANGNYDGRTATLTVKSEAVSATLSVSQKQKGALILSATSFSVPAEGETLSVVVKANSGVTATSSADWIQVVSTRALEESEFRLTVAANEAYEPRTGTVAFANEAGSETVTVEQAAAEKPSDPGSEDLPETGSVALDKLYGYAEGVTGGDAATSANILHFDNGKALQTWLLNRAKAEKKGDHTPVTIWLSGTFGPEDGRDFSEAHPWFDVKEVSNLSFYGTDSFVMDRIGIFCVRASNIVIRNINFRQPKANNGADAVSMQECEGVWVDHCTFTSLNQTKDYEDGSTDITHGSKNVTVSWNHYILTQKSCLVGHSNSQSSDTEITATFHHNWFDKSSSRHPRVRFGKVHVYNNLYDANTTYGVGSAYGAKVLVEYNYFDGVQLPTDICTYPAKESGESNLQGSVAGYLYATQNVYVNRPAKAKDPYPLTNVMYKSYQGETITPLTYADFKPAYDYIVTPAEDVPTVVKGGAGYGKLGWTEAPVAVNNGGITDFNGSDPDDPDQPGGGDDPGGNTGAHTYVLYMNDSASPVSTVDGQSGSTYFTYTTSAADFRTAGDEKYHGPFEIDGATYSRGFKFDSKGSISFTTSSTLNTTVRFYFARRKVAESDAKIRLVPTGGTEQVWDTPYGNYGDSGVVTLERGTGYTLQQKASEQAVILVIVTETE